MVQGDRRRPRRIACAGVARLGYGPAGVASTILGTRTVEQLDDNLGAAQLELDPEQVARLDEVSDPGLPPYPYGFIEEMSEDRTG